MVQISFQAGASSRRGTGLIGKAILKDAIELLPYLPETDKFDELKAYFKNNLRFSSEETRSRYTRYITKRMFPGSHIDRALPMFAKRFASQQALKDVCYYRFCRAEPIMLEIMNKVMMPAIGRGQIHRNHIRDYLAVNYPTSLHNTIQTSAHAIIDALLAGGLVRANKTEISFSYRDILVPSFAFVLHSEFSEPDMYDLAEAEENLLINAMLWRPDQIVPTIYELRNKGLISKVSEIDSVRQFTTKFRLDDMVEQLVSEREKI